MTAASVSHFFLLPDEVATLTGYKATQRQIDWLRSRGWRFELNANHRPVIARRYAEKMLGCGSDDEQPRMIRPNFTALRGA
jgi:hypothetical protein